MKEATPHTLSPASIEAIAGAIVRKIEIVKDPVYLTCKEVNKMASISTTTRINWTRAGRLRSYHIGGVVRYRRDEVIAAIEGRSSK